MILQIPENISRHVNLSEKELLLELSILFFQKRILSIRKASELSSVSQKEFKEILAKRNIPFKREPAEKNLPTGSSKKENNIAAKRLAVIQKYIGKATYPDFPVSKHDVYDQ